MSMSENSQKSYTKVEKVLSSGGESRTEDLFNTFSADQLTDDYCDVLV